MKDKPNPGSDAALEQGCVCPRYDNARGAGFMLNGRQVFWIIEDCPLHGGGKDWTSEGEQLHDE